MDQADPPEPPADEPVGDAASGPTAGTTRVRPEVLRVVADPVALQALTVLCDESLCACHLADPDVVAAPVAERLGDLASAGLVETERRAGQIYYRLRPGALDQVRPLMPWLTECPDEPRYRPCP